MTENIRHILDARNEFIGHLEEEIKSNTQTLEQSTKELHKLQETVANVKSLGKYPEHTSIIPLAKNIYMRGRIVHTGEYYIKKKASPESYIILKSLEETLNSLQGEVKTKEKDIQQIEHSNHQLEERLKFLTVGGDQIPDDEKFLEDKVSQGEELPKEIKSEKGVAVKVGDFYEILEFEEDK